MKIIRRNGDIDFKNINDYGPLESPSAMWGDGESMWWSQTAQQGRQWFRLDGPDDLEPDGSMFWHDSDCAIEHEVLP